MAFFYLKLRTLLYTIENSGLILNLTDAAADKTRSNILQLSYEKPETILKELSDVTKFGESHDLQVERKRLAQEQFELFPELIPSAQDIIYDDASRNLIMPERHQVKAEDVNLKRLGAVLATSYESRPKDFESLLLTPGLGPRTLQSLTLISEVIHGTPSRFTDPARFSFAHGGKDGHPFPVPLKIYDESIRILGDAIEKSKMGYNDKSECIKRLHKTAVQIEERCNPQADFEKTLQHERDHSKEWGGRTVMD